MPKNVGIIDRVVRILIAVVVAALIIAGVVQGALAIILGIVGGVLLVTALVGTCPIWMALKVSTRGSKA